MFELGPTFIPFTIHWNVGVGAPLAGAPFTGAPVKVTDEPRQNGLDGVEIEIPTARFGFTIIVKGGDVAGLFVGQAAFDKTVQVITSAVIGT